MVRSLEAIMALDMVGYSRLMAADEEGTHARLKAHREELLDPAITKYRGHVIKNTGDGLLAEFPSAVDCVACAVEIQRRMARRNQDVVPDRRMELRIGINVGDIMKDGGDIYGTGVAVRLEGLADPGGILISEDAHRQIHDKLEIDLRDRGPQHLKNIDEPVRAYAIRIESGDTIPSGAPATKSPPSWRAGVAALVIAGLVGALAWQSIRGPRVEAAVVADMAFPLPDRPSIAVLAFVNLSGDPDQDYLADGVAEDILTALSKLSQLFVISGTTTFTYKGRDVTVKQVAEDLGVRYVLEGSVQRDGEQIRVTAQLIDALSGEHVWAESYDRNVTDLFGIKDEITLNIVANVGSQIALGASELSSRRDTESLAAWRQFRQGMDGVLQFTREENVAAREHLGNAIATDPEFASAYAWLGTAHRDLAMFGWSDDFDGEVERAYQFYQRALEIDGDNSAALSHMALLDNLLGNADRAMALAERAVSISPNDYSVRGVYGRILMFDGQYRSAVNELEQSARLSPVAPEWVPLFLGQAYLRAGNPEQARPLIEEVLAEDGISSFNRAWAHKDLATVLAALGEDEAARAQIDKVMEAFPSWTISGDVIWYTSRIPT